MTPRPTAADTAQGDDGWVPYREAARQAGVPVKTVRNWHQAGKVPRRYTPGRNGQEAWVPLDAVLALAGGRRAATHPAAGDPAALREAVAALHDLAVRLQAAEARASKAEAEVALLRKQLRAGGR